MNKAEMKVIRFDANDVIATSSYVMSGLGDGKENNLLFNGLSGDAFKEKYGSYRFIYTGGNMATGNNLIIDDMEDTAQNPSVDAKWNGRYTYFENDGYGYKCFKMQ